jgi:ammonium transporter Rh
LTDNDIESTNIKLNFNDTIYRATEEELNTYDGIFRDINIMTFAGFGMFHTLLKRYSWTSITINMMGIAFSFQIGLFTNLLWENAFKENWKKGVLNFQTFIKSIISSCSIIISLGCVLGKLSSTQYIILIIIETIMSSLNFQLCDAKLKVIDVGGSLYIHTFGAIFGIAIYMVLFCSQKMKSQVLSQNYFNKSNYFSNITSFIGVMFLICYFPSFNTALALDNGARYRASINTYFSIAGSIIGSFITSALFNKGKIFFEHILFGCFSGGVIISGCCSVCLDHWAALLIGFLCGGIIVTLLSLLKPYFIQWKFYDIYNIIIIHCIPGILGAFITSMMIGDIKRRKDDYYLILLNDMERENNIQAGIQVGAIFITIGLSFISGIASGYLMKISTCGKVIHFFTDSELFENDKNIIDNLEQNQFYSGPINRASLFQNKIDFPPSRASDIRASHPSYN